MKVGVFTSAFGNLTLEKTLDYVASVGVEAVEIGTGNYPRDSHCNPDRMLESEADRKAFIDAVGSRGLVISALSCHGNPLHPNAGIAGPHHEVFQKTIRLAELLGVERVNAFSGCPGSSPKSEYPNWVTCSWPTDFAEILKWQWESVAIPYWREQAEFAKEHGVKVCLEMHPGFLVYNTDTLLRLREACGEAIGANFDPSHLFWQGIDPVFAIRKLGDAIFHVHAKDCKIDPINCPTNGVLDTKSYLKTIDRSWIFRTVGYGHGPEVWKDLVSNLRLVGYDWVLSIEHEDSLMSQREGFEKAVGFLKHITIQDAPGVAHWV